MYIDLEPLIKQLEPKRVVGVNPTLAILKYGDRPDSTNYIGSIDNKADKLEINTIVQDLKCIENIESKIAEVQELANAILPVNPFPGKLKEIIKTRLDRTKDIDNFTGESIFDNCTGEAVLEILKYLEIGLDKDVCIVGRHIGLDVYKVLLNADYTPRPIHSKTPNPLNYIKNADVIISATGVKNIIRRDMIKPGATIIDVGLGDVDKGVAEIADVTPVRHGVGAVTTQVLFRHVLDTI
ncbi:MAG: bifunctional 5,10-methylenetetrahydrofolate dehydrogenase/5,10-methenyltetrahydrofolate cyclohydrolase [Clostridium lundense]|nr:bifunctional 5,10-methylenetetrahydrofolate dehydrogenase/5,10-methenyltetrahydrofolate cyclohydrolase [Clostridium lundense]